MRRTLLLTIALTAAIAPLASAQTVVVNIESTPPGAEVRYDAPDGQLIGRTPLSRVRLPRGSHTLYFTMENYARTELPVNVRQWNETFRATLQAQSTITINAGNSSAEGASVRIDGEPVGTIPVSRHVVTPGRHLVQVGREGYDTASQWVDVQPAQALNLQMTLEQSAPETGSLLVAGDTSGAIIVVDGQEQGAAPTVLEGLSAGQHTIEVRPPAGATNLQAATQTVTIIAGQRATMSFSLAPEPPEGGTLRILANVAEATIFIDGEPIGNPPAVRAGIAPGDHIVEARASGYEPLQQTVTVEAGRERAISVELQAVAQRPGRIVVNTNIDGASVTIDGEQHGTPPVVIEDATPGTHAIVVSAPGRRDYRDTCTTAPGQDCELDVDMANAPTPIRVVANIQGAQLFVDGELQGPVPFEGTILTGQHLIEVRAAGYVSYEARLNFEGTEEPRLVEAFLTEEGALTPDELLAQRSDIERRHQQAVARSGVPLPQEIGLLDFSVGWPYLFEARLGIGITDWLDAGVAIRTFGRLTEFEGRAKVGYRPVEQFSLGAQLRIGGGIGPTRDPVDADPEPMMMDMDANRHPTSSFFFSLEALFSLHFANAGNFTLWTALDFTSDRWDWARDNRSCRFENGCEDGDLTMQADSVLIPMERQNIARFRLGGSLEIIFSRHWNGWISFEGAFGQPRRVLGDIFGAGNEDLQIYTRIGLTYKFDYGH